MSAGVGLLMANLRLGVDIGTSSLGWALFELDDKGDPQKIKSSGVRIFADGRDPKSLTSLKATRREKRQARRNRDRYLQRRKYLLSELFISMFNTKGYAQQPNFAKFFETACSHCFRTSLYPKWQTELVVHFAKIFEFSIVPCKKRIGPKVE